MSGGKPFWIEVETRSPNDTRNNPAKGGVKSPSSISFSGKKATYVGKTNLSIIKKG